METNQAFQCAVNYLVENYMEEISLSDLERVSGVSKFAITRLFRKNFNMPPLKWLWHFRAFVASKALKQTTHMSCSAICYACGFESPSHFVRVFRRVVGQTPNSFRNAERKHQPILGDDSLVAKGFSKLGL